MKFGNKDTIAIEVAEFDCSLDATRFYVQFRFILFGQFYGNWDDSFPLSMAYGSMKTFISCKRFRQDYSLANVDTMTFYARTFTAFYEYDYKTQPILRPNLRDRYHLSEVGGDSICDKLGIVVVEIAPETSRIVVKDLQRDQFLLDRCFDSIVLEEMGNRFTEWAEIRCNMSLSVR